MMNIKRHNCNGSQNTPSEKHREVYDLEDAGFSDEDMKTDKGKGRGTKGFNPI